MEKLPEPDVIDLMHRRNNGVEVFMNWHRSANIITIALTDSVEGVDTEFIVPNDKALHAFDHPYVWMPRNGEE